MSEATMIDRILVQREDFSLADEYARLAARQDTGAVVSFVGKVRDFNQGEHVKGLALEHYPGMTEKALTDIVAEARSRWPLQECTLIHRIGELLLGDQIVLVVVSSAHREAAFEACHFIMDFLKTRAPFWKKRADRRRSTTLGRGQGERQHCRRPLASLTCSRGPAHRELQPLFSGPPPWLGTDRSGPIQEVKE